MSAAAKIGAFMILILAIVGFLILRIEDIQIGGDPTREVTAVFEDVAGLDEKSPVRLAGVRVGTVTRIHPPTPEGRALVTMEVEEGVQLRQGASAKVTSMGLLGEKYVELDPGPVGAPIRGDTSAPLPGSATASIDQVTDQVSEIATDVKAITASLRNVLGGPEGEQRVEDIVVNVRTITERLRFLIEANEGNVSATAENLRALTADLRAEIPRIVASIERFTETMTGTVGENREDVRAVMQNMRELSTDLKVTADNLNGITGQVKSGEGSIGKLIYSDEAHDKLTNALDSVEGGVTELRNTLGRIGKLQLALDLRSEYYAGRDEQPGFGGNSRSSLSAFIKPNPEKNRFLLVGVADDPRGKKREKITETLFIDAAGNETTTTERETRFEREFLLSAQAGWQLEDFAVRLGLFESTGGVGADYKLNDRTLVTGEAFDFGRRYDDNAHLRLFGTYVFRRESEKVPALFVTTGVDDVLNDVAVTFGGGIRWSDDDLKYLLGSIPTP